MILLLKCLAVPGQETRSTKQEKDKALADTHSFLDEVLKRYATAKTYHIELVEESELNSDLRRTWERHSITAAVLPDKRY